MTTILPDDLGPHDEEAVEAVELSGPEVGEVPRLGMPPAGTSPGIEHEELLRRTSRREPVKVICIDYSPEEVLVEEVADIDEFLARHRPPWSVVRWINIAGLSDMAVIRAFAQKYELHPLAIEDLLLTHQRAKVDDYPASEDHPGRLFVVARVVRMVGHRVRTEQVSCFLGRHTLVTFQERSTGFFASIRQRILTAGSRIRQNDVSFLLYTILDVIVDSYFPILDRFAARLELLENRLYERGGKITFQHIHRIKRELVLLRRSAWPLRELVSQLVRESHPCLSETTHTYLRDAYDHVFMIIDSIEVYRELAGSLTELYMSLISNRMNDIMKTLTIISTIFVPLTFFAGVYGMNMPIPENHYPWMYFVFWGFSLLTGGGMLAWFRWRGWF